MSGTGDPTSALPPIYDLSPPHGRITEDDHGAYVVIVGWVMMCFFTISVLTRLLTRFIPISLGGIDDILSAVSMFFAIVQTAAIHISASNGLGQHQDTLSAALFDRYSRSYYIAHIFYLLAIVCAKASLIFLIIRLSPAKSIRRICQVLLGAICFWMCCELFVFAFQCQLPHPWNYLNTCSVNVSALYYTIAAGDIISDLVVILLPAYVIWHVQIPLRKRLAVIAVFGSRIVVPICAAIRISTLPNYLNRSDRSWEAVRPQTWLQIIQCLPVITACIPCLKPFLESLESGFMDLSLTKHSGSTYGGQSGGSGTSKSKTRGPRDSYMLNSIKSIVGDDSRATKKDKRMSAGRIYDDLTPPNYNIRLGEDAQGGQYLEVCESKPGTGRQNSVSESERALTSRSDEYFKTNNYGIEEVQDRPVYEDGIRVMRTVEIREEKGDAQSQQRW